MSVCPTSQTRSPCSRRTTSCSRSISTTATATAITRSVWSSRASTRLSWTPTGKNSTVTSVTTETQSFSLAPKAGTTDRTACSSICRAARALCSRRLTITRLSDTSGKSLRKIHLPFNRLPRHLRSSLNVLIITNAQLRHVPMRSGKKLQIQ